MKLILHVGNHKTGSTAIQTYLSSNDNYSFLYPNTGRVKNAHHDLVNAIRGKGTIGFDNVPCFDQLLESLKKEVLDSNKEITIISSEEFITLNESQIRKMSEIFELFDVVELVCVLRNQIDQFESSYKFSVLWKHTSETLSFDDFLNRQLSSNYNDYFPKLNSFKESGCFDNINVLSFSELIRNGNMLKSFFEKLGLNLDNIEEIKNNESLGRNATLLLREYNRSRIDDDSHRAAFIKKIKDELVCDKSSIYTHEQYSKVIDRFNESNAVLKEAFGIDLNKSIKNISDLSLKGEKLDDAILIEYEQYIQKTVHHIHIGKCAGGTVNKTLRSLGVSFEEYHCGNADQRIKEKIRNSSKEDVFVITVRDPISRFISSFNFDKYDKIIKNKSPNNFWNSVFETFESANDLALNLLHDGGKGEMARRAIGNSKLHMHLGLSWYLSEDVLSYLNRDNTYIIRTENIKNDMKHFLRECLMIEDEFDVIKDKDSSLFESKLGVQNPKFLSDEAKRNLKTAFTIDYNIFEYLLSNANYSNSDVKVQL